MLHGVQVLLLPLPRVHKVKESGIIFLPASTKGAPWYSCLFSRLEVIRACTLGHTMTKGSWFTIVIHLEKKCWNFIFLLVSIEWQSHPPCNLCLPRKPTSHMQIREWRRRRRKDPLPITRTWPCDNNNKEEERFALWRMTGRQPKGHVCLACKNKLRKLLDDLNYKKPCMVYI